jgi:hypothetical protein
MGQPSDGSGDGDSRVGAWRGYATGFSLESWASAASRRRSTFWSRNEFAELAGTEEWRLAFASGTVESSRHLAPHPWQTTALFSSDGSGGASVTNIASEQFGHGPA